MTYRRHNKDEDVRWRKRVRYELIKAGLPDFIVDDERRWIYVLLHGADEFESGWSPDWISGRQAESMLSLLESHYKEEIGLELFSALRRRIDDRQSIQPE